ncbi:MAG: efflux RND transporter periplasmic adaptor subunit [Pseudomonadota bacterium]|nr:efflux RND transporter periplasmic adaptor subunit [Pseudomonadota bacterium]
MLKRRISNLVLWSSLLQGVVAGAAEPMAAPPAPSPALVTATVGTVGPGHSAGFDGVVEAVRQTVLAAQVAGAVVALDVKVGDAVKAGQVLARIDARAADQNTAASDAQVMAARASLDMATKDLQRQKQLFQKSYISQGALERAESQFKSTEAQVAALLAQAGATRTQSGFFVVKAPYAGIVSEVPVGLGDMAMPGRPLLTLYDPTSLRVTVSVPQSAALGLQKDAAVRVQLPGLPADREWVTPSRTVVLPTVDPATHSVQLRLEIPPSTPGTASDPATVLAPGLFARAWLPGAVGGPARLNVPARAVVRHAEMTGLYVVGADGRPMLRQVRLGSVQGDSIEILSGVSAGERVAIDPQAAARAR